MWAYEGWTDKNTIPPESWLIDAKLKPRARVTIKSYSHVGPLSILKVEGVADSVLAYESPCIKNVGTQFEHHGAIIRSADEKVFRQAVKALFAGAEGAQLIPLRDVIAKMKEQSKRQ